MANSETSFGDRLARGRQLQAAVAGFSPVFSPADAMLSPTAFKATLDGIETLNAVVANSSAAVSSDTALRASLMGAIKERVLQVLAFVKSNTAWKTHLPSVKQAADAVRGYRPSQAKTAPADGTPAKPKRKVGQQSYGDIDLLFEKVIEAVKPIPGYLPPESSNIQKAQLASLLESYRAANSSLASKAAALSAAQGSRLAAYEDEATGLRFKMKNIKDAVKAQYGPKSPEFEAVKGIRV